MTEVENLERILYSVPYRKEVILPESLNVDWNVSEKEMKVIRRLLSGDNLRFSEGMYWWSVPLGFGRTYSESTDDEVIVAKELARRYIIDIRSSCRGGSYFLPVGVCQHMDGVEDILKNSCSCKVQAWRFSPRRGLVRCGYRIVTKGQKVESMSFHESCIDSFSYEPM